MEKVSGMSVVVLCWGLRSGFAEDLPTNNDPARQIRFLNVEEAQERRMKFAPGDLAGWVAPKSPTQGSCQRNEGGLSAGVIPLRAPGGLQHRTPFRNETRHGTSGSRTQP